MYYTYKSYELEKKETLKEKARMKKERKKK